MSAPRKLTLVETSRFYSFVLLIFIEIIPLVVIFVVQPRPENAQKLPVIQGIVGAFVISLMLFSALYSGKTRITLDADARTIKIVKNYVLDLVGRAPQLYKVSDVKRVYIDPPMKDRSDWIFKRRVMIEVMESNGALNTFSLSGLANNITNVSKWDLVEQYNSWRAEHGGDV